MSSELIIWPLWANYELVWIRVAGRCWDCGGLTHWADLDFMTFLHPGLCSVRKWREYQRAEAAAAAAESSCSAEGFDVLAGQDGA